MSEFNTLINLVLDIFRMDFSEFMRMPDSDGEHQERDERLRTRAIEMNDEMMRIYGDIQQSIRRIETNPNPPTREDINIYHTLEHFSRYLQRIQRLTGIWILNRWLGQPRYEGDAIDKINGVLYTFRRNYANIHNINLDTTDEIKEEARVRSRRILTDASITIPPDSPLVNPELRDRQRRVGMPQVQQYNAANSSREYDEYRRSIQQERQNEEASLPPPVYDQPVRDESQREAFMDIAKKRPNPLSEFICPITGEIMFDPVVASDGNTYERYAIIKWFKTKKTSPITSLPINEIFTPNLTIRSAISRFIDGSLFKDMVGNPVDLLMNKINDGKEEDKKIKRVDAIILLDENDFDVDKSYDAYIMTQGGRKGGTRRNLRKKPHNQRKNKTKKRK